MMGGMDTTTDLEAGDPRDAGWDPDALERAIEFAGERATYGLCISVDGKIIAERYWNDWSQHSTRDIASAQKSVVSLLVGISRINLDDPVSKHVGDGWTKTTPEQECAITVRHLITMTSGLAEDFTFEAPPGTVWFYNNGAYHQTARVLQAVHGKAMQELSEELLFGALGMRDSKWIPRPRMLDPNGIPMNGLHSSPRDLVRFGRHVLDRLGDDYVRESTSSSQDLNPSYGYLWWLNGKSRVVMPGPNRPVVEGPMVPSAPHDMFAALGAFDQKVYVIPSRRCVISRLGDAGAPRAAASSRFDREWWDVLSKAIPS